MVIIRGAVALLLLAVVSACSSVPSTKANRSALNLLVPEARDGAWHAVRFKQVWPEGEKARWHIDTLIAHRVVAPTLLTFQSEIPLWRFHRRASRDLAGHRFSFIFYATEEVADAVTEELESSELVASLRDTRVLEGVIRSDYGGDAWQLSATSDASWSEAVQRSWPHFIMGVSRTWLELIASIAQGRVDATTDTEALIERYAEIDAEVTELWSDHGQHAFLHHLNAIYGYKPFGIRY